MTDNEMFPYREIWLKPVQQPTRAQIKFFREQHPGLVHNDLGYRQRLIEGKFAAIGGLVRHDQIERLLEQLNSLSLPYEVRVAPINKHRQIVRELSAPRLPDLEGPRWSDDERREYVVDLSHARSQDDFVAAMDAAFPCGRNADTVWSACRSTIVHQHCPISIPVIDWSGFAQRMPQYTRNLRDFLDDYQQQHALQVEYVD